MTTRAIDFMTQWIGRNIVEDRYLRNRGLIARAFIARCHEELNDAGISPAEVADSIGPVETVIIEAMEIGCSPEFAAKIAKRIPRALMH